MFKKYREFWIFTGFVYSIFDYFVALCWYSKPLLMLTRSVILNVLSISDSPFAWTRAGSSSIFAFSKKWIKEVLLNFVDVVITLNSWFGSDCFWLILSTYGTNFPATRIIPKALLKIEWHEPIDIFSSWAIFLMVIRRMTNTIFLTTLILFIVYFWRARELYI